MMEELIRTISEYLSLSSDDAAIVRKSFVKKMFPKGSFLIEQGKVADQIFFIESGLVRLFFINEDGDEVNTYFSADGSFITSFSSFVNRSPSTESLKAEGNSVVYSLSYADFVVNSDFMIRFRVLFAEQNLVCIKKRIDLLQQADALEKYQHFLKNTDQRIVQGIPLYHIASYLGITPESLSRLRKKVFLTKSQEE